MTRINFDDNYHIYLFAGLETLNSSSKLNEFLSFLKFQKVNLPFKFSFVSSTASLIPEMTLNENILIDFTANSLTESKVNQFQEFLKLQGNRSLESLYQTIILPNEFPAQSDAQMNKVCSLIKSLLFEGQFIFLEEPETDLDPETLKLFTLALKEHLQGRALNVFIYTKNLPLWLPHAQLLVERTKNYAFTVSQIENYSPWENERKNFYSPVEIGTTNVSGLKIKIPAVKKITAA